MPKCANTILVSDATHVLLTKCLNFNLKLTRVPSGLLQLSCIPNLKCTVNGNAHVFINQYKLIEGVGFLFVIFDLPDHYFKCQDV